MKKHNRTGKQLDRYKHKHTDKQLDRYRHKHTDKQLDGYKHRHSDNHSEKQNVKKLEAKQNKRNKRNKQNKRNQAIQVRQGQVLPNFKGQHFLHNPRTINRLLAAARLNSSDIIFEIGAGGGSITLPLAEQAAKVIAIEVDADCIQKLRRRIESKGCDNIKLIQADVRACRLPQKEFSVVANIPFSITKSILVKLLGDEGKGLKQATLIIEDGAARRFTQRNTTQWQLLTWRMLYTFKYEGIVPRTDFSPPPKVDAAIIRIKRRVTALVASKDLVKFCGFARFILRAPHIKAVEVLRAIFTPAQMSKVLNAANIEYDQLIKEINAEGWAIVFHAMVTHVPNHRWPRR